MASTELITATETRPNSPPIGLGPLASLRWSRNNPPHDFQTSFAGKTVLVTGANTGLGFEAAAKYAVQDAEKLILAVRTVSKGEEAKQRILERIGRNGVNKETSIVVMQVDLLDYTSVKNFVGRLERETPHLDVALLNAGLGNPDFRTSPVTGYEMAIQVNVLSTALMAVLLLPLLRSTAKARGRPPHLTFVNSHAHNTVREDWLKSDGSLLKAASTREGWDTTRSYSMVKLLGMAVMQAVARTNAPETVIVNAVCPDLCKTDLGRNFGGFSKIAGHMFQALFARTAEEGSRSLVSATALGPESHGRFWHHDVLFP